MSFRPFVRAHWPIRGPAARRTIVCCNIFSRTHTSCAVLAQLTVIGVSEHVIDFVYFVLTSLLGASPFALQVGVQMATNFRTFILRALRYIYDTFVGLFVERRALFLVKHALLGKQLLAESSCYSLNRFILMIRNNCDFKQNNDGSFSRLNRAVQLDENNHLVDTCKRKSIVDLKKVRFRFICLLEIFI